jgi:hypothetical protein
MTQIFADKNSDKTSPLIVVVLNHPQLLQNVESPLSAEVGERPSLVDYYKDGATFCKWFEHGVTYAWLEKKCEPWPMGESNRITFFEVFGVLTKSLRPKLFLDGTSAENAGPLPSFKTWQFNSAYYQAEVEASFLTEKACAIPKDLVPSAEGLSNAALAALKWLTAARGVSYRYLPQTAEFTDELLRRGLAAVSKEGKVTRTKITGNFVPKHGPKLEFLVHGSD